MRRSTRKIIGLPLGILLTFTAILGCQLPGAWRRLPATNSAEAVPGDCPPCYEDTLSGGRVFSMYCGACHNARALGERPLASYENAAAHMRVRANLTGEEYRKLMAFLRYWHDIPPQTPPVEPSPKRFIFSQPLSELQPESADSREESLPPQATPTNGT